MYTENQLIKKKELQDAINKLRDENDALLRMMQEHEKRINLIRSKRIKLDHQIQNIQDEYFKV